MSSSSFNGNSSFGGSNNGGNAASGEGSRSAGWGYSSQPSAARSGGQSSAGNPSAEQTAARPGAFPQAPQGPGAAPFASQAPNVGLGQDSRRPAAQGPTPVEAPTVSLPKGGGAVQPIAEKFSINPATGAGSMSVGVALSPGRGLSPEMTVGYSTGGGNGPFGMGWGLSVPSISRKTDKGLPQYVDAHTDEADDSDTFLLSGAEDLVRVLEQGEAGAWTRKPRLSDSGETRYRYRPRTEGSFLRIERVVTPAQAAVGETPTIPRQTRWEVTGADNVTHVYGASAQARVADPAYPTHVFQWLLEETRDDKGSIVRYEYKAEDLAGVPLKSHEAHRHDGRAEVAGRYLKRVLYGNKLGLTPAEATSPTDFHFEAVLDYGEHDAAAPKPEAPANAVWPARADAFSSYRAGFEQRTYRLCRRILMFHRFAELDTVAPADGPSSSTKALLVRSTDFTYEERADTTYLTRATQRGYAPDGQGGYTTESLPPADFTYSRADALSSEVKDLDATSARQLTSGPDGRAYQWVDLNGEGVSGALTQQGGALYYKRNLGGGKLGAPVALTTQPNGAQLSGGGASGGIQQLVDLTGDGLPDLVELGGMSPGYHARTADGGWSPKRPFQQIPNVDFRDPSLRFLDLTGDGYADLMMSEDHVYRWYGSKQTAGYDKSVAASRYSDERKGPSVVFAEAEQTVFLADMSGDGLQDLVRVRNGSIVYWPNLGRGRFGAQIVMGAAPAAPAGQGGGQQTRGIHMAPSNHYDPSRVRLADIDGTGTADLVYIGADGVKVWRNQAGNRFAPGETLAIFPGQTSLHTIDILDLLGTGTGCLVWSTPLTGQPSQVRYVDFLNSTKPHLLIASQNNLGLETKLRYTTSTQHYLDDLRQGISWAGRLPFPVHIVDRVEHYDHIRKHRFVSTYRYRHGHYDAEEREFRGFGYVEQRDAEAISGALSDDHLFPDYRVENGEMSLPPVVTKSWYHTGAWMAGETLLSRYEQEWFDPTLIPSPEGQSPYSSEPRLGAPIMPQSQSGSSSSGQGRVSALEHHQAHRALAGQLLRQEVYAEDGSAEADKPYVVTQQRYQVRLEQPRRYQRASSGNGGGGANATLAVNGADEKRSYGVFLSHALESLSIQYERNPADPRIGHELVLEVDALGYPVKSAAAAYARKVTAPPSPPAPAESPFYPAAQYKQWLSASVQTLAHPLSDTGDYRHGVQVAAQSYELHDGVFANVGANGLLSLEVAKAALDGTPTEPVAEVAFDATLGANQKRLLSDTRIRYYDYSTLPAAGESAPALNFAELPASGPLLSYASYAKVLTADMLGAAGVTPSGILQGRITAAELTAAGYLSAIALDDHNNTPVDANTPAPAGGTIVDDGAYWAWTGTAHFDPAAFYQVTSATDPYGNTTTVGYDPHRLFAITSTDPLGNTTAASQLDYRVMAPARVTDINGHHAEALFDTLGRVVRTAVMGKSGEGDSLASDDTATSFVQYDIARWMTEQKPARIVSKVRETHHSELASGETTRWLTSIAYTDGSGGAVMSKTTAAPGPAVQLDASGAPVLDVNGNPTVVNANPRWLANGRTVVDNKGNPIKQYEPYFSPSDDYEDDPALVEMGVTPIMHYDPLGRLVRMDMPDGTYSQTHFDPWQQTVWDANDTAAPGQAWYDENADPAASSDQRSAAAKAAAHAETPAVTCFDTLGRPTRSIAQYRDGSASGSGAAVNEAYHLNEMVLDISGNTLSVLDSNGRACMQYAIDMLGQPLRQDSIDSGKRWMMASASGEPVKAWGERSGTSGTPITHGAGYDALRRPTHSWVDEGNGAGEVITERYYYGETHPSVTDAGHTDYPNTQNLRGRLVAHYDASGAVFTAGYDFKGQPLATHRRLTIDYKNTISWAALSDSGGTSIDPGDFDGTSAAAAAVLETEVFTHTSHYDALGRPTESTAPDGTVTLPKYNEAGQLIRVEARLRGAATTVAIVPHIEYDAHGRRSYLSRADHSAGGAAGPAMATTYAYDPRSFRLTRLKTQRLGASAAVLQDLRYTYDAVGNITSIRDYAEAASPKSLYYNGSAVSAHQAFRYDTLYRLTEASGREHHQTLQPTDTDPELKTNPSSGAALQNYTERYQYDALGNLTEQKHTVPANSALTWTRAQTYGPADNRLLTSSVASTTVHYTHDVHGNMRSMPHLSAMDWDHADQLRHVDKGGGGEAWFQYDASGERTRKVWEHSGLREERLYLGGFELWRRRNLATSDLMDERETVHLSDGASRVCLVETKTHEASAMVASPVPRYRYQLDNHLGTVAVEVDEAGSVISYEEYHPYGTTAYRAAISASVSGVSRRRYRYTGKEKDEETGLYYHGARYYAPWLARWTAADPSGLVDGANLFAYVRGNPVALNDPDGMQSAPQQSYCRPIDGDDKNLECVVVGNEEEAHPDAEMESAPAKGVTISDLGEGGPEPITPGEVASPKPGLSYGEGFAREFGNEGLGFADGFLMNAPSVIKEQADLYRKGEFRAGAMKALTWAKGLYDTLHPENDPAAAWQRGSEARAGLLNLFTFGEDIGVAITSSDQEVAGRSAGRAVSKIMMTAGLLIGMASGLRGAAGGKKPPALTKSQAATAKSTGYYPEWDAAGGKVTVRKAPVKPAPVAPALGAQIAPRLLQELQRLVGTADTKKFQAALKKGVVGPRGQSGIKKLSPPWNGYTHELKIGGSGQRLFGKLGSNGQFFFDFFKPGGLHKG